MSDKFEIKIGTITSIQTAEQFIPQFNVKGFESYELETNTYKFDFSHDLSEEGKRVLEAAEGRPISCIGHYGNTMMDKDVYNRIQYLIHNVKYFNCNTIGLFAGADPNKSVYEMMPEFKKVFSELCKEAEDNGVRLALEGCGAGWYGGSYNIAFCTEAYELIFDAIDSPALGIEWEPAHAINNLCDPVEQLRCWAHKVFHIHGKDGTIDKDLLRKYGVNGGIQVIHDRTPGFGDSNWSDFFTILLSVGFKGSCDIEGFHDPVFNNGRPGTQFEERKLEFSAQLAALDYLKRCRGGIEYWEGPTLG